MRVIIKTEAYDLPVTSVYLAKDQDDHTNSRLKMFFCFNCQTPLHQYRGNVTSVVPGEPVIKIGTVNKCKNQRCNMVYCFRAIG